MPFVEREHGIRVHYDDYGQGRPLAFNQTLENFVAQLG